MENFWKLRINQSRKLLLSQILTIRRILIGVRATNLTSTILFVDFSKVFDSKHREKMGKILIAYGLPKETVAAIMMLYENTKVKVRSPERDKDFFDIVTGVQQGDTWVPYLFIICLDYVLRTPIVLMKENGSSLQSKDADDSQHKQLRTRTTPMT